jgi:hypothetical protein
MKKTATVFAPRLRRLVRDINRVVLDRFAGAKYDPDDLTKALSAELAKVDLNHPDFRNDIARTFVKADLADRAKIDPFTEDADGRLDPALFQPELFAHGVIRLGNGFHIRMADATSRDWIARQLHQQEAAEAAQQKATKTTRWLQTEPGVLLVENPTLRTAAAMRQLNLPLWDAEPADTMPDDDAGDE